MPPKVDRLDEIIKCLCKANWLSEDLRNKLAKEGVDIDRLLKCICRNDRDREKPPTYEQVIINEMTQALTQILTKKR